MKQAVVVIVLLIILACSASVAMLSSASAEVVGVAPQIVHELRQTDTLDELQQFQKLERPSRPVWPFVLGLVVSVGLTVIVAGTPFLKQANSTLRLFKRKGGGGGGSRQAPPPLPIVLPPGYGQQPQHQLTSGGEENEW